MKKLSLAALVVALSLAFVGSADAQPRQPNFGRSVANGIGFGLGQRIGLGGGFFGSRAAFGFRQPFVGGFGHGGLGFRQQFVGGGFYGAQFQQQMFFRQSYYAAPAAFVVPQPLIVPQPVIVDQPQAFVQPVLQQAVSACGTLGLGAGYGYGALGLGGYGGCGQFRQSLRFIR